MLPDALNLCKMVNARKVDSFTPVLDVNLGLENENFLVKVESIVPVKLKPILWTQDCLTILLVVELYAVVTVDWINNSMALVTVIRVFGIGLVLFHSML